MLIGATVLCFLVLLVLVADRLGASVWHGGAQRTFYRCERCDLRYPRSDLGDPAMRVCPAGHPVALEEPGTAAGMVGIFACLGFLTVAIALVATGWVTH
ncbi:MAG: hypothetical protein E6J45_07065 [Chloroflexi bacterium]|nr:MAG: hypothetical protein E6J45_07065 [Chloroflexota bacterium]